MRQNKDAKVATRLDSNLAAEFEKILIEKDLTKAQVLRWLIRDYVEKHKMNKK